MRNGTKRRSPSAALKSQKKLGRLTLGEGYEVAFEVLPHANRRRMGLFFRHSDGVLELRTPPRFPVKEALSMALSHARLICTWIDEHAERQVRFQAERPDDPEGWCLPCFGGEDLTLRFAPSENHALTVQDGEVWIDAVFRSDPSAIAGLLERWYRRTAAERLRARLLVWGERMGIRFNRLTIRAQKSRWGSCSSRGNINLNWQLMLLKKQVCDYVLIHELAHRVHPNHSADFWGLVTQYDPEYRAHRQALKRFELPWPFWERHES